MDCEMCFLVSVAEGKEGGEKRVFSSTDTFLSPISNSRCKSRSRLFSLFSNFSFFLSVREIQMNLSAPISSRSVEMGKPGRKLEVFSHISIHTHTHGRSSNFSMTRKKFFLVLISPHFFSGKRDIGAKKTLLHARTHREFGELIKHEVGCREERGSLIKKVLFLSLLDSLRSSPLSPEIAGKEIKAINFASGYNKKSGEKRGSTYTTEWPMCSLCRKIVASPSAPQKTTTNSWQNGSGFPKEGKAKKKSSSEAISIYEKKILRPVCKNGEWKDSISHMHFMYCTYGSLHYSEVLLFSTHPKFRIPLPPDLYPTHSVYIRERKSGSNIKCVGGGGGGASVPPSSKRGFG